LAQRSIWPLKTAF